MAPDFFHRGGQDDKRLLDRLAQSIDTASIRLETPDDLGSLVERIGDRRIVMLGEASHGTSDFYLWRIHISRKLIEEKGFSFVAVEGDWPDCQVINQYVRNPENGGTTARDVMKTFKRWPTWMWANWEVVAFCDWLKRHNRQAEQMAGFYGLDVYSLWESLDVITRYLEDKHPEAARAARQAFACFEPYGQDEEAYAMRAARLVPEDCEAEVLNLLTETRESVRRRETDAEAAFNAEMNAMVTVRAEQYYRIMMQGGAASWNHRDTHMMETLDRLLDYHGSMAKAIVWAHNTHIGDARATSMAASGMYNIGELCRKKYPNDTFLAGFGTYSGSVIAGEYWGAPNERMPVPESPAGTWEDIFHRSSGTNKMIFPADLEKVDEFHARRGHRAIGVVYHPRAEWGNYVPTRLHERYDAFLFFDNTAALHPLDIQPAELRPETYPWGV